MRTRFGRTVLIGNLLLTLLGLGPGTGRGVAQGHEPAGSTSNEPAHFSKPPHPAGPPILAAKQLSGPSFTRPFQAVIYKMAALIAPVLYEQPCFCRCDLAMRHKSLHSCFEGLHGAACGTCMREVLYAYQQSHQGKSPAEIRAGIERGEWQQMNLEQATL